MLKKKTFNKSDDGLFRNHDKLNINSSIFLISRIENEILKLKLQSFETLMNNW